MIDKEIPYGYQVTWVPRTRDPSPQSESDVSGGKQDGATGYDDREICERNADAENA